MALPDPSGKFEHCNAVTAEFDRVKTVYDQHIDQLNRYSNDVEELRKKLQSEESMHLRSSILLEIGAIENKAKIILNELRTLKVKVNDLKNDFRINRCSSVVGRSLRI